MGFDFNIGVINPEFSQNTVTFHLLVADCSGSMEGEKERAVARGLNLIKDELSKLEDTSSTRVALIRFGSSVYPSNLERVEDFSISYRARNDGTALYATICYIRDQVAKLYDQYRDKYRLNINVIMLSDGENCSDLSSESAARAAVSDLRGKYKAATIFYAIESDRYMENVTAIARDLGFDVKRIDGDTHSIEQMSRQVSTMLVSSSRSGVPVQLGGISATLGKTVSKVAEEKYGASLEDVEEEFEDPFAAYIS